MSGAKPPKESNDPRSMPRSTKTINPTRSEGNKILEALIVIPPDGGWGWVVVVAAFICNFTADGTMYTFGIFLDEISMSIGCSNTEISLANSLMTGCYYMSGPFISALTNRYGFRVVGIMGGLLSSVAVLATSFAKTLVGVLFLYGVLGGVGFGMLYMPSIIVIGFYFEKWRALATSIAVCGSSLGIILFPPIFTTLLKNQDWRTKFRILSLVCFFCALCSVAYRPIIPVKVITLEEKEEIVLKRVLSRYRNTEYPTTADLQRRSAMTLVLPRPVSNGPPVAIGGQSTSTPRSKPGPVTSFVISKLSEMQPDKLRTVYEDAETVGGRCKRFWIKFKTCSCCKRRYKVPLRPLYRDDIFYTGSLARLPISTHSSMANVPSHERTQLEYTLSVTRIMTQKDIEEEYRKCVCCPEAMKRTLVTMLDMSLLKSPSFMLLCTSGLFTLLGLYIPFLFIAERAKLHGMQPKAAYLLISTLGISNTVGRILSGVLSSLPNVNALLCSVVSLMICGVAALTSSLSYHKSWQFGFASIYGATISCIAALRPIIIVEMVGLQKLTNAFGICLLFQGVACLTGIPFSAFLRDLTGDFEVSFYFTGGVILISAVMLMPMKALSKWEHRKLESSTDLQ